MDVYLGIAVVFATLFGPVLAVYAIKPNFDEIEGLNPIW
jgi:hypothetical protein